MIVRTPGDRAASEPSALPSQQGDQAAAGMQPSPLLFDPKKLEGFKYFELLGPLLAQLHDVGTARDRAGNRELFYDQYAAAILFYFFNPVLTSLRGIQQATTLEKVQQALGIQRTSLGSLSEASRVFDAQLLRPILAELAQRLGPLPGKSEAVALAQLTAVDGSLFAALPKMAWALWNYDHKKAVKLHLHFEVFTGAPIDAQMTYGKFCEKKVLHEMLQAGRFYVMDRGYEQFRLFQAIVDIGSSFVCGVRDQMTWTVIHERTLSDADRAAGVIFDAEVNLGGRKAEGVLTQPYRVVQRHTGKTDEHGQPVVMTLVTNRMDLAAELIVLAYHYRWQIELFFRWLKCVLGCRHLLSTDKNGLEIQIYLALIASLLISLWVGRKPTKRTYEMLCFYFMGVASLQELTAHISSLKKHAA
jgi:hypothetical protein